MKTESKNDIREDINAANQAFMAAFQRGDAQALAALYTPTAQLLAPHFDVVTGPAAIQTFWQGVM